MNKTYCQQHSVSFVPQPDSRLQTVNFTAMININKFFKLILIIFLLQSNNLLVAQVNLKEIKSIVYFLSDDDKLGRKNGSPQSLEVSDWIKAYYENNGLESFNNDYFHCYTYVNGDSIEIHERNVVGLLKSTDTIDQMYIIISAHFDHLGTITGEEDSVYNGANDNATGVALMLGLIHEFKQTAFRPYNLIFAAFSGEEEGLRGSADFAENLPVPREKVQLNLNFDMLGRTDSIGKQTYFITGSNYTNLKDIILDFNRHEKWKLDTASANNLLFLLSDNYSFIESSQNSTYKIPAHTFSTDTPNAPDYHSVNDEADRIDYKNLLSFTRYIARLTDYIGKNKTEIKWLKEIQYEFEIEEEGIHFQLIKKK
ncbi:MAG: M28 family metallopeptidase [Lentimicrobium sp.]